MSTAFIVPVVRRVTKRETWKLTRHANPGDRPSNRPLNNPAIRFGCAGVTCCGPVDSNWPLPLPQHRPRRPSLPPRRGHGILTVPIKADASTISPRLPCIHCYYEPRSRLLTTSRPRPRDRRLTGPSPPSIRRASGTCSSRLRHLTAPGDLLQNRFSAAGVQAAVDGRPSTGRSLSAAGPSEPPPHPTPGRARPASTELKPSGRN